MARAADLLRPYQDKRDFEKTPEPKGSVGKTKGRSFVVQKHDARRLHFDFRLELDGVLKSWAVTKGPSLDPGVKRLAVRTEDHPLDYGGFEGVIPSGYGAGTVIVWDRGTWSPQSDPHEGFKKGVLKFTLEGERLKGGFALVRMKPRAGEKRENWLLVKERDEEATDDLDPVAEWDSSVISGKTIDAMAQSDDLWTREAGKTTRAAQDKKKGRSGPARKTAGPANKVRLRFVKPQLASLREAPPKGAGWLHEIKYDGYRIVALIEKGAVRLMTRNEKDWTHRYKPVADALAVLSVDEAIVDGELAALDRDGRTNFGALQDAERGNAPLVYFAFDLLRLDGEDLRRLPLEERKSRLKALLADAPEPVRYSDHVIGAGGTVRDKACAMGLEGVVSKKRDAPYVSGRGTGWIKSKCVNNDEFVIGGYRKSGARGRPFSSLLLGEYENGRLAYRGRVGTGFDTAALDDLSSRLRRLERKTAPFATLPADARRDAVFVTPSLVCQIAYTERTKDGVLRHPSYLGLREDKEPEEAVMPQPDEREEPNVVAGVKLTNPGRVLFPEQGVSKRDLAEYYAANAERILAHVKGRPLSLVRCPDGRQGACFFQKHFNASTPDYFAKVEIAEKKGQKSPYLMIDSVQGLVASAQIGALELHVWGARADRIERPERVVFDLDPDEAVPFSEVKAAAAEVRDVLASAGLESYPLLTGGKGVHVIAPLARRAEWPLVKTFARALAEALSAAAPDRYVASASKARRKGKIFIDWMRNERGATAIAPYSPRARPGAPVAAPVAWRELARLDSAARYTLSTIGRRLSALKADPWPGYFQIRQSITESTLKALGA